MDVTTRCYGNRSLELAELANEFGEFYVSHSMLNKAQDPLLLASDIREERLGKLHADYATTLFNLGTVCTSYTCAAPSVAALCTTYSLCLGLWVGHGGR